MLLAMLALSPIHAFPQAPAQPGPPSEGARLVIESFAPATAYVVGTQSVYMAGTVRNVGREPSAAGAFTARIYTLTGLEYTEGDTMPKVPALEPNASVTFKWRLLPSAPDAPLVASLSLEGPGRVPDSRVAAIQHFSEPIPADSAGFTKEPYARANHLTASLENASVRVRVFQSDSGVPALIVSNRTPTGWRRVGATLPVASVESAEGGQRPWWEVFRVDSMRPLNAKGVATLDLTGGFGLRWRGTVTLTLRKDSSIMDARLSLAPLKPVKISRVRFLPFFVGDGSFGAAVAETLTPEPEHESTAAVRWGAITIGTAWLGGSTVGEWKAGPIRSPEGADYHLIGAEWSPESPSLPLTAANMLDFRSRLFALSPSASVADARKIPPPARPAGNAITSR